MVTPASPSIFRSTSDGDAYGNLLYEAVLPHLAGKPFRTAVDDQVARKWRARNEVSERGYFSMRAPRFRGIAAASPWAAPTTSLATTAQGETRPTFVPGGVLGFTAIY